VHIVRSPSLTAEVMTFTLLHLLLAREVVVVAVLAVASIVYIVLMCCDGCRRSMLLSLHLQRHTTDGGRIGRRRGQALWYI
jgi:hypothetical protein